MSDKIKILIISNTPWDDNNSFGSSFSNIFGGNSDYSIANIYCQPGSPNTNVCQRFFQITEKGILNTIIGKQKNSGQEILQSNTLNNQIIKLSKTDEKVLNKIKIFRWQLFFWIRDLIWGTGKWKSKSLDGFISDFNPDIVFLPIYYSSYLNQIGLYAKKVSNVKMVGYISDDCYTFKQFSFSPLFWIDRIIKRPYIKKAINQCEILYTITETQQKEYSEIFGNKCKVLYKGGDFNDFSHKKNILNNPIQLVYTGNLGNGRWKSLVAIANALKIINKDEFKAELHIYTQTPLSKKATKNLQIEKTAILKGSIPASQVKDIQKEADILIHVESFNLSERYSARLSFSTKIVDYLEAGRCILAVGWKKTGGIAYLKENDAAIVVVDQKKIENVITRLMVNNDIIKEYGEKSFECGKRNHQINLIRTGLYKDLKTFIKPINE